MQVILLERIDKLGAPGGLVDVKRGYARNYLLPQGKALVATKENKEKAKAELKAIIARDGAKKAEAETMKNELDNKRVFLIRAAGESGQLYGSVRATDIANAIESQINVLVSKKFITLDEPIRKLGISNLKIRLHPQVDIQIQVNIAHSEDEAKSQAIKYDREIERQKNAEKNKAAKQSEAYNNKGRSKHNADKKVNSENEEKTTLVAQNTEEATETTEAESETQSNANNEKTE